MSKADRAKQRRIERELNKPFQMNMDQLLRYEKEYKEEIYTEIKKQHSALVLSNTLISCMHVLKKNNGFGKKRMDKFIDDFNKGFISIQKGDENILDWKEEINGMGIDLKVLFSRILINHKDDNPFK